MNGIKYEKKIMQPDEQSERLRAGEKLFVENHEHAYLFMSNIGSFMFRADNGHDYPAYGLHKAREVYIKSAKQWFDEIPEHGVLCRIANESLIVVIVKAFENTSIDVAGDYFTTSELTPLTNQEIKAFLAPEEASENWEDSVSTSSKVRCYVSNNEIDLTAAPQERKIAFVYGITEDPRCKYQYGYLSFCKYAVPVDPELRNK